MNHDVTLVVDEAAFSEAVHEIGDSGAGDPDHGSQCVVRDSGRNDGLSPLNSDPSQFQQDTRQPLFLKFDIPVR